MPTRGEQGADSLPEISGPTDFNHIFAQFALADSRTALPYFNNGEDISKMADVHAAIQYIMHPIMTGMQMQHALLTGNEIGRRGKYRWPYAQQVGNEQFRYGFTMYTNKTDPLTPIRRMQMNFGPMLRDFDNWYNLIVTTNGQSPTKLSLSQHYGGDPLRRVMQTTSDLELDHVAEENRWDVDLLGGLHPGKMAFNEHEIDFANNGIRFTSRGNDHQAEYVVSREYDPRQDNFTTQLKTNPMRFREIQPKIVYGQPIKKDAILDVIYAFTELIPRQSNTPE